MVVSPDRALDADPAIADRARASVLEMKSKVPTSHFRKQWRLIDGSKPSTNLEAAHFAQVQLLMQGEGNQQAHEPIKAEQSVLHHDSSLAKRLEG